MTDKFAQTNTVNEDSIEHNSSKSDMSDPFAAPLSEHQTEYPRGLYNDYPVFKCDDISVREGYHALSEQIIVALKQGLRVLVIDGYHGVNWTCLYEKLSALLAAHHIEQSWFPVVDALADEQEIQEKTAPFLGGDDPVFGTHYPFGPEVFFDAAKIARMRVEAAKARGRSAGSLTVFYGTGAGLIELWDRLWYMDIAKDLIQLKAKQGELTNLGINKNLPFGQFYKRSYFVDWPSLNRLKRHLLPQTDMFIDLNDPDQPRFVSGREFRHAMHQIAQAPFRVRPWFLPGPWGGKYAQGHMGQDPGQPNLAWSYELIVPENGLVFGDRDHSVECSFDCLMFLENQRVLGKEAAAQFLYEWPIRLDYLDTIDGGNLSVQCHPRPDYIRDHFGETYTQDETYYICNAKPGAKVYLGLTEDCDPGEFRSALEESQNSGKEVDIDKYVNSEPAKPHDLFLIPNGTVHCSGRGNLVLEISTTPYIFTFKLYDYLRKDLNGDLRPINIEHAFNNIYFHRRKKWVQENLLAKPELVDQGRGWQKYVLYRLPLTFYDIFRVHIEEFYEFATEDHAFAVNLVAGKKVEISSGSGHSSPLAYLESMVIPAAAGHVTIRNQDKSPCKLVMVRVRPGIGSAIPLNAGS